LHAEAKKKKGTPVGKTHLEDADIDGTLTVKGVLESTGWIHPMVVKQKWRALVDVLRNQPLFLEESCVPRSQLKHKQYYPSHLCVRVLTLIKTVTALNI
jgi:hypothetical protein